ncbi:type II toxin-antitoxin system RelE/ParE family toxin [Flavobacterium sp. WC2509]|uniref:type II toxin-antitoxin system RelE/ParE family toxin n=1 Tax=Flavobacterium sp. WC2509 TaxID=3461406 RepID=UPI004044CD81
MAPLKIIWTHTAKDQLKAILEYYKVKSFQGAQNVKNDILKATRELHFVEQYERDEIEPEYRRIIVRDYKLLYKEEKEGVVFIARIFSTKQNPGKQLE